MKTVETLTLWFKMTIGATIVVALLVGAGLVGLDLLAQEWDAEMEGARQVCASYACLLPFVGILVAIFAHRLGYKYG